MEEGIAARDSRIYNCYIRVTEGPERQQLSLILAGMIWTESRAAQVLDKVNIIQYSGKKWLIAEREVAYKLYDTIVGDIVYKGINLKDRLELLKDWTWANEDPE